MIESNVWDSFATLVQLFAEGASPPLQVIHSGVAGSPPDGDVWLETRFFPNRTENYGLADEGPSKHQGFCQVTVGERPGSGLKRGLDVVGAVIAAVPKGTTLGAARVYRQPWVSSAIPQEDRILYPITVPYELITR